MDEVVRGWRSIIQNIVGIKGLNEEFSFRERRDSCGTNCTIGCNLLLQLLQCCINSTAATNFVADYCNVFVHQSNWSRGTEH